jgi:acetoin:2,6-dichlorophenolindophenol oxidoreductase subunit alpha
MRIDALTPEQRELLIEMYRRMLRIRCFEEAALRLKAAGRIPGAIHPSIGQEGEIVGACLALRRDDYMVGNHRSHGHPIAKGAALERLMAELLGKATGVNHGKGGSLHLCDVSVGSLGETSSVGSGLPIAVGAALGAKRMGTDRVCLCFFGEGAANEGTFHESLNLAALWRVPVIFLCENNLYGGCTSADREMRLTNIADRAHVYGIPGESVDGQSAIGVHQAVSRAVARARAGAGPSLVEAKTYRYLEHAVGMALPSYRDEREVAEWRRRDPIALHRAALHEAQVHDAAEAAGLEKRVSAEVEAAVEFALRSPFPEPHTAFEQLYSTPVCVRAGSH